MQLTIAYARRWKPVLLIWFLVVGKWLWLFWQNSDLETLFWAQKLYHCSLILNSPYQIVLTFPIFFLVPFLTVCHTDKCAVWKLLSFSLYNSPDGLLEAVNILFNLFAKRSTNLDHSTSEYLASSLLEYLALGRTWGWNRPWWDEGQGVCRCLA